MCYSLKENIQIGGASEWLHSSLTAQHVWYSTPSPPYFRGEPSFLVSLNLVEIYYRPLS